MRNNPIVSILFLFACLILSILSFVFIIVVSLVTAVIDECKSKKWRLRVLIGFDQLMNTFIGGHEDNTISSRAYHNRHRLGWAQLRWFLDKIDKNHCRKAYEREHSGQELI